MVGTGKGEEDRARHVAQPYIHGGAMGLRGVEVHVERCGRAAKDGLQRPEPRARVDASGIHDAGLLRPDALEEALQIDLLGNTAKERHREVGMEIDQPRHNEQSLAIDDRVRVHHGLAHAHDATVDDRYVGMLEDAARLVAHEHVTCIADDEVDAHASSASIAAARPRIDVTVSAPRATTAVTSSTVMG